MDRPAASFDAALPAYWRTFTGRHAASADVAQREGQSVTDARSVFQHQLEHYVGQGYAMLEVDDQHRRAKLRIRVNLVPAPGSRVIAATPGYRYTYRLLTVDDDGAVHDEEIPS